MYLKKDMIKLGQFDISDLVRKVSSFTEQTWTQDESRQEIFDAHTHTQTIKLLFDADYRHTKPTRHDMLDELWSLIEPLASEIIAINSRTMRQRKIIAKYGPGYFIRMVLIKLKAHSKITKHVDDGYSLKRCHRVHIPIISNEECFFSVGKTSLNMRSGEMWEINNRQIHAVENNGSEARVHMILDYVQPGERVFDPEGPLIA